MYTLIILAALAADRTARPDPLPPVKQRLIVVADAQLKAANDAALKVFGPMAKDSFTVRMQSDTRAVYYVACWRMSDAKKAAWEKALQAAMAERTVRLYEPRTTNRTPVQILTELRIRPAAEKNQP